jgi:hypothetical protein
MNISNQEIQEIKRIINNSMASESNDLLTILLEFLSEMPTKPQQSVFW